MTKQNLITFIDFNEKNLETVCEKDYAEFFQIAEELHQDSLVGVGKVLAKLNTKYAQIIKNKSQLQLYKDLKEIV